MKKKICTQGAPIDPMGMSRAQLADFVCNLRRGEQIRLIQELYELEVERKEARK